MVDFLILFFKFATFGVATEVVFTSSVENYHRFRRGEKLDWSLKGHSYIWMIPIYGSVAFFAPLVIEPLLFLPLIVRLFCYALFILFIEYITGWIILKITGRCPWHYDKGWQVHNLIRIDFIPFWMVFGGALEFLYRYVMV